MGYAPHTDPAEGKVLKGIYAALVKFDGDKGTVRVKSHINSDVISLCDKAGNPIAGVSASKVADRRASCRERV